MTKTITIALIAHDQDVTELYEQLDAQTIQPDEVLLFMSGSCAWDDQRHLTIVDKNREDWGHYKCKLAIEYAKSDYVAFWNVDAIYDPRWIERMLGRAQEGFGLVLCDFMNGRGEIMQTEPRMNKTDRGNVLVSTYEAKRNGYNAFDRTADGRFVQEIVESGVPYSIVREVLFYNDV